MSILGKTKSDKLLEICNGSLSTKQNKYYTISYIYN